MKGDVEKGLKKRIVPKRSIYGSVVFWHKAKRITEQYITSSIQKD